jgi:2-dehydro-3-deoxyphosphooctonate aldolase (KDO 8-P synthase)
MPFEEAAEILSEVGEEFGMQTTTDVHDPSQIQLPLLSAIDMLQIPAFLARQQPLLEAAARTHCRINVKKPQFLRMQDAQKIIQMLKDYGAEHILLTHRGTGVLPDLAMDPRDMLQFTHEAKKLVDITHPNKGYPVHSGLAAEALAYAFIAAGADGIFLETHPYPSEALCDAGTQLDFRIAIQIIENSLSIYNSMRGNND